MSAFFSLKNKLGLISFIILALNFAIPHVQAKSTEGAIPKADYDYSSPEDLVFLSIHEMADLYYVVMVQKSHPQDKKNPTKSFSNIMKDKEKFEISIPLSTSRKDYKAFKENIRKLTSSPLPSRADLLPE